MRSVYSSQHYFFQIRLEKRTLEFVFRFGILLGGVVASQFLMNPGELSINPNLKAELATYGITDYSNLVPAQLMNFASLLTIKGFITMVVGGFLVGFGTVMQVVVPVDTPLWDWQICSYHHLLPQYALWQEVF